MNNSQIGFATFKREEDKHNGLLASMHGVFFCGTWSVTAQQRLTPGASVLFATVLL